MSADPNAPPATPPQTTEQLLQTMITLLQLILADLEILRIRSGSWR